MRTHTTCATLLARLSEGGDASAWREFTERYGPLVAGFAQRRGLQDADRDEVTQEVLTALHRAMPGFRYDPARGKFRSYLKTATLRAIWRLLRQRRGETPLDDAALEGTVKDWTRDTTIDEQWEREWRQYHLSCALRSIEVEFSARDRTAFHAYALEGRSAAEVAERHGLSTDQVYQAKSRILRRLTTLIARQVEDEG